MSVRLFLFGPPKLEFGDESLALPFERRTQLLVYLALKRAWVGRAELVPMFWPDLDGKLAYANLRKTLHRLQSLPWAGAIALQGNALRFEADTDVFDFESALREQRTADALPLRRGELLAGFEDDASEAWSSWLGFERDRLRVAWRSAALDRLNAGIDPAEAIDLSARLLEVDPLDEAALHAHISWLAKGGQSARARQVYQEFAARLAQDLGIPPGTELKALHDSLGSTVVRAAPPQAEPAARTDRGFVGRSAELRRIAELLAQDDCRLLSVIGPGGMGKTRLAQRAMEELAAQFTHGAAFVPLEDVSQPGEIAGRLAREIDLNLAGNADSLEQVIAFLRERHMLLALDNFEQLLAGAVTVQALLQSCPRLKIIVTSRVRLALPQEWLLPLEGLPCPEVEDEDRFEAFDAVRLFVKAAQRVEPALIPSAEAAAIVEICRHVEGLPLALELAAAWTRVLSCEAIAAELRQGTELLRTGDAARPTRHASIEAVFEQSWRLLSATEREALAKLSVFRGGFTPEAARAVAKASLPVLGALTDKSLLRKDGARMYLHPLVHQLAAARVDSGVLRVTATAHAGHFHRTMAQLQEAIVRGERDALRQIDVEFENCQSAWLWSVANGPTDVLFRSSRALLYYFDHRGRPAEGLMLLRQAADSPLAQAEPVLQATLLSRASHLEYRLDRYSDAEATASRALAAARGQERGRVACEQALIVLASSALRLGRLDAAQRHYREVLDQASDGAAGHQRAATLDNLSLVEKLLGNFDEALRLSLESLGIHRDIGDSAGVALCLNNLASLYLSRGEFKTAEPLLREGLAICERDGLAVTRALVLANLFDVTLRSGDLDLAEAQAGRALEAAEATGNRMSLSWLKVRLAHLAMLRNRLDAARAELAEGLRLAIGLGIPFLKSEAVMCFAELLHAQGEASCAGHVLAVAAAHPATGVSERERMRAQLQHWGLPPNPPKSGIGLDALLQRAVVETDVAYAPLIAALREV